MRHGQLTLASLANLLSKHLGLSGNGLSAFQASEQIALETFYREHPQLGLVTCSSGLGKSALLKRFMGEQSPQHCTPIYCHLAHLPSNGLLKVVLGQLGEVPRRGKDKRPLTKDQTCRYIDFQMSEHGGKVGLSISTLP